MMFWLWMSCAFFIGVVFGMLSVTYTINNHFNPFR